MRDAVSGAAVILWLSLASGMGHAAVQSISTQLPCTQHLIQAVAHVLEGRGIRRGKVREEVTDVATEDEHMTTTNHILHRRHHTNSVLYSLSGTKVD